MPSALSGDVLAYFAPSYLGGFTRTHLCLAFVNTQSRDRYLSCSVDRLTYRFAWSVHTAVVHNRHEYFHYQQGQQGLEKTESRKCGILFVVCGRPEILKFCISARGGEEKGTKWSSMEGMVCLTRQLPSSRIIAVIQHRLLTSHIWRMGTKVIIMPPSALDRLASLRIDYPMLFEVHNPQATRTSHCGVLEFVAEEGMIYMPYWMMQNMLLQEGDIVRLKSATLPKGTYVKLQPHTKDFLDISNPKAVLETTLRNFSCLTVGDNIMVAYNNKKYYIDIIEAKPAQAISIIETDCEVDFAPPLDYVEPEPVRPAPAPPAASSEASQEAPEPEEPKFNAFTGTGRRLDGKPVKTTVSPVSTPVSAGASSSTKKSVGNGASGSSAPTPSAAPQRPAGKLVFGGGSSGTPKAPPPKKEEPKPEPPKEDNPKFQAFTGKKYSLRG
ncbi:hypothetical protein R1sor_010210 [Riccia sorocarpa]|uniref:Ubiquitin fusion degradaton protein n=1 Tax=Riccia sorocarpa TaxID=122646 RepID=A0ABD3I0Q5_9MARC